MNLENSAGEKHYENIVVPASGKTADAGRGRRPALKPNPQTRAQTADDASDSDARQSDEDSRNDRSAPGTKEPAGQGSTELGKRTSSGRRSGNQ